MQSSKTPRTAQRKRTPAECCTDLDCKSGLRNNYFEGKRLSADSFKVEQAYGLERRRLINRAVHGWGVVYGYAIAVEPPDGSRRNRRGILDIGGGLAFDKCGRELLETGRPVRLEELIVIDADGVPIDPGAAFSKAGNSARHHKDNSPRECWLLRAHYAEQSVDHVGVEEACHCKHEEWDRTCETVRYSLERVSCDECCIEPECELTCDCGSGPCCDPSQTETGVRPKRGGCQCLCTHLIKLPQPTCGPLCLIEEPCAVIGVDLKNGVPLACIHLIWDARCDDWSLGLEVEPCGPRPLVKRNDLLFDLIRGCDLTRISEISWKKWHRLEIDFDEFSKAFGPEDRNRPAYETTFAVTFSRPVKKGTVLTDCFAITIMCDERRDGWWEPFRVPIARVDTTHAPGDPADHIRTATIVVDGPWVEDGLRGARTHFLGRETVVEIEIRGDFIIDCNGQAVDANAVGLSPCPTGNGTPGGTFLSSFRVKSATEKPYRPGHNPVQGSKGAAS